MRLKRGIGDVIKIKGDDSKGRKSFRSKNMTDKASKRKLKNVSRHGVFNRKNSIDLPISLGVCGCGGEESPRLLRQPTLSARSSSSSSSSSSPSESDDEPPTAAWTVSGRAGGDWPAVVDWCCWCAAAAAAATATR